MSLLPALIATLIIPVPAPPATPKKTLVRQVLRSGLRLIVVERPDAALCALDLRVRVGAADETEKTLGMAHAVEHLLFKGSADRAPGQLDAAVEALGGEMSAHTTRDATRFSCAVPGPSWRAALGELSQLTLKAAFRQSDWLAERSVIESERAFLRTDVVRTGNAALARALWAEGEPYGTTLLGIPEALRRYGADDLRLFWKERYVPAAMTLVVAGPVKADEVVRTAEELFPGGPEPPRERPLRRAVPRPGVAAITAPGGLSGAATRTLLLGWPTPPAADAHAQATLLVLAELLAPAPDAGRLAGPLVRARSLARTLMVEVQLQRAGGLLIIGASAPARTIGNLESEVRQQLRRIAEDGFSADEVALAQASVRARLLAEEGDIEAHAARLALFDSLDAPEAADAIVLKVKSVGAGELVRALKLVLKDDARTSVLVGGQP